MLVPLTFLSFLVVFCIGQSSSSSTPSCLDEEGKPVDWYIAYKFPVLKKYKNPFSTGYAYAYMTSDSIGMRGKSKSKKSSSKGGNSDSNLNQWTISDKLITDSDSMILKTLRIAYDHKSKSFSDLNTIFYNDHPPTAEDSDDNDAKIKPNSRRAHAKGAVVVDETSGNGFWLSHSTPQFPQMRTETLAYAKNSRVFGQTFICLNFDLNDSGREIFEHLINMRPLVYESHISDDLMSWMPELSSLQPDGFKGKRAGSGDGKLGQTIKTRAGQEFNLYSKSGSFNDDIFAGWLDDELDSSLYVETWRNGAGNTLNSTCPTNEPHINNVQELKVITDDVKVYWTYRQDHSKWAISDSAETGVVCISDINRAESQFVRGGGAICIKCPKCWNIFSDTILEVEPCPKRRG